MHVFEFRHTLAPTHWGGGCLRTVTTPGPKEGTTMQFVVIAIIAIVGVGIYMRTRAAR